ncbi:MAG: hypothetical protein USCAAHI_00842 [Beijerinckiaceae bacterium]|nr:MAG: hypothetical protein USCAAHI_00842 [Beijerinckiaceae bacterium]
MMVEIENLVLNHLRHMRVQLDRMEHKLEDVVAPLGHLERSEPIIRSSSPRSMPSSIVSAPARSSRRLDINQKVQQLKGSKPCH